MIYCTAIYKAITCYFLCTNHIDKHGRDIPMYNIYNHIDKHGGEGSRSTLFRKSIFATLN